MHIRHSNRHTRRGFLRGDSTPKFYPVKKESVRASQPDESLPPVAPPPSLDVSQPLPPPPTAAPLLDFSPLPNAQPALPPAAGAEKGHAFLSWLADQITGQALPRPPLPRKASSPIFDFTPDDEYDPHVDYDLDDISLLSTYADPESLDNVFDEAAFGHEDEVIDAHASAQLIRGKEHPHVHMTADGRRCETFAAGSRVLKDVLGRVVEVHSQFSEQLYLRYGVFGNLEHTQRLDPSGVTVSDARKDKHGVVVRDNEGRVRAAGDSMACDPHGCFYVHSPDGSYFGLDLVNGLHSERRLVTDECGRARYVTSLFTHDGFRMATMFGPLHNRGITHGSPGTPQASLFRFYGRDGTMIEFASEDDLNDLNPARVTSPASRPVHQSWLSKRQANTAWDSVHDYLIRVS